MIDAVMPTYARTPMGFEKGDGCWLYGTDGNKYLDAGAGIAVNALGHSNPLLVEALTDQANKVWHTSNLYRIPKQEELASLLVENTFADTVFFTNSGAEAVECTVKVIRKYWDQQGHPERNEIITFNNSFHGRTLGMISAAGGDKLTKGFGPLLPGFVQVEPADITRIREVLSEKTAGILVEPVLGEGGIIPLPDSFLRELRSLCDEEGILLALDEIQCGMGRTGKLFAHEWAGITPDIMAIAKGIGGGFPLGACLATEKTAQGMTAGTHGSTYGGNPLACAVGCRVLSIIAEEAFLEQVRQSARWLRQQIESVIATYPDIFEEVRGEGLMLGLKCKVNNMDVVNSCYDQHLLTVPGGDNVIRILPPLIIDQEELGQMITKLEKAATSLKEKDDA